MSSDMNPEDFFVTGGTMRPGSPSYVKRQADDELFERVIAGEYCYILTARQMGKSSLMVYTAGRLRDAGIRTAIVDLTEIGVSHLTRNQWYLGILTRLKAQMGLSTNIESWWTARDHLNPVQRFTDFLRYVLLSQVREPVAIFIDEIDNTLSLPWTDPFFAAIRAAYNNRTTDPDYRRLTFVLLGVATPNDLIVDPKATPFNVGHHLDLREFTREDARVLQEGLEKVLLEAGEVVFDRILEWTNGQPYMTQKLCAEAAHADVDKWTDEDVDKLVEEHFLSKKAQSEPNLQFIREYVLKSPDKVELFQLYKQVYEGKRVREDKHSVAQNQLKVIGLLGTKEDRLEVRNQIYRQVFNKEWIDTHVPNGNSRKLIFVPVGFTAVVILSILAYLLLKNGFFVVPLSPTPMETLLPIGSDENAAETGAAVLMPSPVATLAISPGAVTLEVVSTAIPPTNTPPSTPTNTWTPTGTPTPTDTPTPTPIPIAVAREPASIFMAPDTRTQQLGLVRTQETVEVLGRSENRFGIMENKPGLYIRTSEGVEGFVVALFFDWPGNVENLLVVQPKLAIVLYNSSVYERPDPNSQVLANLSAQTHIEVFGRSDSAWLYIRTENGTEGFVERNRIDWRGNIDSLTEQD